MTLPEPDLPDEAAKAEYWKQLADAAVELAKTDLATAYADARAALIREKAEQKANDEEFVARRRAEGDAELDIHKQVLVAMIEIAKGSIDRSRDSAKFVQTVSAALAAAYTTILALVFAAKDNPLPPRGFIPTIFFGLAAGLATAYLAFLIQGEGVKVPVGHSLPRENALRKVVLLIRWTAYTVHLRAPFLRAGVCALLLGIVFLPVAVVDIKDPPSIPWVANTGPSPAPATVVEPSPSPGPSPSATPTWPPPPSGASSDLLAVELYKAQLKAHLTSLGS